MPNDSPLFWSLRFAPSLNPSTLLSKFSLTTTSKYSNVVPVWPWQKYPTNVWIRSTRNIPTWLRLACCSWLVRGRIQQIVGNDRGCRSLDSSDYPVDGRRVNSTVTLRVGLTGSIAVGKSFVLEVLHELGARTVDADKIARDCV